MRKLSREDRVQILRCLVDGVSIRGTCRITGKAKATVTKLLVDVGAVCARDADLRMRGLSACKRLQCDEIWSFVGAKEKRVKAGRKGHGDVWTWTAICADTKLVPCWHVGPRDGEAATAFVADLANRIPGRLQLTTDGHRPYLEAVESAFHGAIDYAMLIKIYGGTENGGAGRYSPADCTGTRIERIEGEPDKTHVSTSYVERQNLTMRMGMRRFTRLTNAFSKKVENHIHAVSLHFWYYNFARIHKTLRTTPAMAAGVVERLMDLDDLIALMEAGEPTAAEVSARRKDLILRKIQQEMDFGPEQSK
jgi:IS1 family transposase